MDPIPWWIQRSWWLWDAVDVFVSFCGCVLLFFGLFSFLTGFLRFFGSMASKHVISISKMYHKDPSVGITVQAPS